MKLSPEQIYGIPLKTSFLSPALSRATCTCHVNPEPEHGIPTWSVFLHKSASINTIMVSLPVGAVIPPSAPRW